MNTLPENTFCPIIHDHLGYILTQHYHRDSNNADICIYGLGYFNDQPNNLAGYIVIDKQTYSSTALLTCITNARRQLQTPILPHNRRIVPKCVIKIIETLDQKQAPYEQVCTLFKRFCVDR